MVTRHLGIFLALACILLTAEKELAAPLEGQSDLEGVTPCPAEKPSVHHYY